MHFTEYNTGKYFNYLVAVYIGLRWVNYNLMQSNICKAKIIFLAIPPWEKKTVQKYGIPRFAQPITPIIAEPHFLADQDPKVNGWGNKASMMPRSSVLNDPTPLAKKHFTENNRSIGIRLCSDMSGIEGRLKIRDAVNRHC
jgi:hypothetical protein